MNGGFASTWFSTSSVTFLDALGTYQLLWVNNKLNKFIFALPQKSISTSTVLNITNITNPYPYQFSVYTTTNNLVINFYNNYYRQSTRTINQPSWGLFTTNVPLIYFDKNLPSNTLDTYPITNRIGSGATTILRLGVNIE
jgi:hypothetical protein